MGAVSHPVTNFENDELIIHKGPFSCKQSPGCLFRCPLLIAFLLNVCTFCLSLFVVGPCIFSIFIFFVYSVLGRISEIYS